MLSQIRPQAPLLVVPIRPCLIFMFNVLSALPGFRPRLSQEILCIAKLMTRVEWDAIEAEMEEMERFKYPAGEEDLGAVAFGSGPG